MNVHYVCIRRAIAVVGALCSVAAGTACRDRSIDAVNAVIARSDSSGIEILSLEGKPTLRELPLASATRRVSLDSLEVDEVRQIRMAQLLDDGRIALAVTRPLRVVVVDSLGAIQRLVGRTGDGPGEYRAISALRLKADAGLVYFDVINRRLTEHGNDNSVKHATTFAALQARPGAALTSPAGILADGSVLVRAGSSPAVGAGLTRPPFEFVRLGKEGGEHVLRGPFAGDEVFMGTPNRDGFAPMGVPPFGRKTVAAVCGSRFVEASNDTLEVRLRDSDGRTQRVFRAAVAPHALTRADYVAYWKQNGLDEPQQADVDRIRQMTHGDSLPIISALHCASDERLLIEFEPRPTDETRTLWYLRPSWDEVVGFTVPVRTRLLSLAGDHLLVAWQDGETRVSIGVLTLSP